MSVVRTQSGLVVVASPLVEAFDDPASGGMIDSDEYLWRSLSTNQRRDLLANRHDQVLDAAFASYQSNPLGHRITTLNRDFIVGDGITYSCSNPNVEDIIGEFWTDDDNDLEGRNFDFALELGLYGELILEVFPSDVTGQVKLGYIDPYQVKGVEHVKNNPLIADVVHLKDMSGMGEQERKSDLPIVRNRTGAGLEGEVFYFKINSLSNSTRGWPDLLHLVDWLDAYDQVLWEVLERARLMRTFIWDVTLEGSDQTVREWLTKHRTPPRSGTVRAHNKSETWTAVAPQLGSFETAKDAEVILEHIAGGAALPKHWLASAEDVNRATAREMGTPTEKTLQSRQRFFVRMEHRILRYVLEQAERAGTLKTNADGEVESYDEDGNPTGEMHKPWELVQIHAPDVSQRDIQSAGILIANLVGALAVAEEQGWFGPQNIRQVLALALNQLGYDYDPSTVPEDLQVPTDGQGNPIGKETPKEPPSRSKLDKVGADLAKGGDGGSDSSGG